MYYIACQERIYVERPEITYLKKSEIRFAIKLVSQILAKLINELDRSSGFAPTGARRLGLLKGGDDILKSGDKGRAGATFTKET